MRKWSRASAIAASRPEIPDASCARETICGQHHRVHVEACSWIPPSSDSIYSIRLSPVKSICSRHAPAPQPQKGTRSSSLWMNHKGFRARSWVNRTLKPQPWPVNGRFSGISAPSCCRHLINRPQHTIAMIASIMKPRASTLG